MTYTTTTDLAIDPQLAKPIVELADCPDDGGKWAIYCEHENGCGILQDTNKRRLSGWLNHTTEWCPICRNNQDIAVSELLTLWWVL